MLPSACLLCSGGRVGAVEVLGGQLACDGMLRGEGQVDKHAEPQSACIAVCVEAYKSWLTTEARTDDITVIVIEVTLGKGLSCVSSIPRMY